MFYRVRTDEGIRSRDLKTYARGRVMASVLNLSTSENAQFRSITSMRVLHILDTLLTQRELSARW
ncbi:MAG: hypothetical protein R2850_09610 [Bacteroidia bacterium]